MTYSANDQAAHQYDSEIETLDDVVDLNPDKRDHYIPGRRLETMPAGRLLQDQRDVVPLLAGNFADENLAQEKAYLRRGSTFVVPIPQPPIVSDRQSALAAGS